MACNSDLSLDSEDGKSIWLETMAECVDSSAVKLPHCKQLLVIGDDEAEKTRLVTKLQGWPIVDHIQKRNGLEYRYLNIRDEYCESQTRLGVWILDEDPCFKPLLKYALDENSMADTTVFLVASMTRPWDIFRTIRSWVQILKDHIDSLDIPSSTLEERKRRVLDRYREYIEPGLSIYGCLPTENPRELELNLGVELNIIVTRTDYMKVLQTDFGYEEEHFDFIQFSLREFCLSHGAALCYVSVKEDKNCDLLLKYILHKIYAFPFRIPAVLLERDSVFVPSGWDNENKIRFLSETMNTIPLSTPYEDVLFQPGRLSEEKGLTPEVLAEGDQSFLMSMEAAMARQMTESNSSESIKESSSMTAALVQRNVARRVARTQGPRTVQKKIDPEIGSAEGDTVLVSFFKSLLNRKTAGQISRPVDIYGNKSSSSYINGQDAHKENGFHNDFPPAGLQNRRGTVDNVVQTKLSFTNKTCNHDGSDSGGTINNTLHLSLDEGNDSSQLPEYFLSNAGSCATDCCFKGSSLSEFPDGEDDFDQPLDRIRSSFNPPLKQLLSASGENSQTPRNKLERVRALSSHSSEEDTNSSSKCSLRNEEIQPSVESVATSSVIEKMPCREEK